MSWNRGSIPKEGGIGNTALGLDSQAVLWHVGALKSQIGALQEQMPAGPTTLMLTYLQASPIEFGEVYFRVDTPCILEKVG